MLASSNALEAKKEHTHLSSEFAFLKFAMIPRHFCKYQVKLGHLKNTKLNFDVGNAGYNSYIVRYNLYIVESTTVSEPLSPSIQSKREVTHRPTGPTQGVALHPREMALW